MALTLYLHPLASFCHKVLVALYENATPFEWRLLAAENAAIMDEFASLWPIKRFPLLVDDDRIVAEASIIIEHLALHHPGPVRLIPQDAQAALDVRMMDRFFDNYVMTPMQKIVGDRLRAEERRDPHGVAEARPYRRLFPLGAPERD